MKATSRNTIFFQFQFIFLAITSIMWITLAHINPHATESEIVIPAFNSITSQSNWETKGNLVPQHTNHSVIFTTLLNDMNIIEPDKNRGELWLPLDLPTPNLFSLQTAYTANQITPVDGRIGGLSFGVILYDDEGDRINRIPLHSFREGTALRPVEEVFSLEDFVSSISLQVRFTVLSGQVMVEPITLLQIKKNPFFMLVSTAFLFIYAIFMIRFICKLGKENRINRSDFKPKNFFLFFIWVVFGSLVITVAVFPSANTAAVLSTLEHCFRLFFLDPQIHSTQFTEHGPFFSTETIAHALVFFALGLTVPFFLKEFQSPNWALFVMNTAVLTETVQLFVNDRNASLSDLLVDLFFGITGLAMGLSIYCFLRVIKSRISRY